MKNAVDFETFEANMPVIFRSQPRNVFVTKIWGPIICLGCLLVFKEDLLSWRFLLASPFLIAAFFGVSLAILEVRDGVLRYRRLFKWTTIADNEILSARVEWPPFIGSVHLKRFLFPWGRLYFVLDANSRPNPLHKGEYPLLQYIQRELIPADQDRVKPSSQKDRALKLKLLIAAVSGALFYGLAELVSPIPGYQGEMPQRVHAHQPVLLEIQWQIVHILGTFEMVVILFVAFVLLAVYRYRRSDAWIFAFLAGVALPRIIFH